MEAGRIPDHAISASSSYETKSVGPQNASSRAAFPDFPLSNPSEKPDHAVKAMLTLLAVFVVVFLGIHTARNAIVNL
ncbi:hypothetical protein HUJ04_003562 [Dendroctonus ponderosae]|nr:hypothetical protein HUJ04_003562 [Dendroctonus ponderosae]